MLKTQNIKIVDMNDWDALVEKTYGKPYCFQQQDDCQDRGLFEITIPSKYTCDDEMHDSIKEVVNGNEMGVKFQVWLDRDPKKPLPGEKEKYTIELFWHRNFYPDIHTLANDLYKKGLVEAGEYGIKIDW